MSVDPTLQLLLTCRRLFLRDHVVWVQIGAHDFEKNSAQRVVFNVELFVPFAKSTAHQDQLSEVVNYDFVREVIAKRVGMGHIELQETLCDDLVAEILAHAGVLAVRLSTCKPDIYPDCGGVGVEVFRTKQTPL
jgi:dihydroneopterin aldolase